MAYCRNSPRNKFSLIVAPLRWRCVVVASGECTNTNKGPSLHCCCTAVAVGWCGGVGPACTTTAGNSYKSGKLLGPVTQFTAWKHNERIRKFHAS